MGRSSLAAALAPFAFAACGTHGDGSSAAGPKLLDAVWCDVQAAPCIAIDDPGDGLPTSCAVPSSTPLPASTPGGDRICFDSGSISPQAACAQTCWSGHMNPLLFPSTTGCSASVDTDATIHPGLNAAGFRPSACTGESTGPVVWGAGTNTVAVSGTGTATYGGSTVAVVVHSGRFNMTAPNTSCSSVQGNCETQINQIELYFDDFSVGGLACNGLAFFLDGPLFTGSGQWIAPQPPAAPNPIFSFLIPPPPYDVIGHVSANGQTLPPAFPALSLSALDAALDLTTGAIDFDFSLGGFEIAGEPFSLTGVATTTTVIDDAPVVTLPVAPSLQATGASCTADMTLTAAASSPLGLPVALTYAVDDGLPALSGPAASATFGGAGTHVVTVAASDSLGAITQATETITVAGSSACP